VPYPKKKKKNAALRVRTLLYTKEKVNAQTLPVLARNWREDRIDRSRGARRGAEAKRVASVQKGNDNLITLGLIK